MPDWALPAATLVAAGGLTYLSCVRPALRGRRGADRGSCGRARADRSIDDQLADARAQLQRLAQHTP